MSLLHSSDNGEGLCSSLDQTVGSSSSAPKEVVWDRVLAALSPELFEELERRDAMTIRTELAERGFLDVLLHGKMIEQEWLELPLPQDEFKAFLAAQVATQYLARTLGVMHEREVALLGVLKETEQRIHETHAAYDRVRAERRRVKQDLAQVDFEIAECDRQLKATTPPEPPSSMGSSSWRQSNLRLEELRDENGEELEISEDEDSPWEDHILPRDHHVRSSVIFGSMQSSPAARHGPVFSSGFSAHDNSPKHSRSRASSGTSGGVTDDEFVLFSSTNNPSWFQDKLKDALTLKKGPLEDINETGDNGEDADEDQDEENEDF